MKKHQVIYGSYTDLISLRSKEIINECQSKGFDVFYLDGKKATQSEVSEAISRGLFDDGDKVVVLENPKSLKDLPKLVSQTETPVLFLAGKVVPKELMSVKKKEEMNEPPSWKKGKWCAELLQKMVKSRGKDISLPICQSIVNRVGQDVGILRYEAMKLAYASEGKEITPKEVMSVLAPLSEMDGLPFVDSVFEGDVRNFLKVCARFERNRKTDPTINICRGLLHSTTLGVLEVRLLLDKKVTSSSEIADKVGKNRWLVENVLLPRAKTHTTKKIREILGVLYHCENLALSGVVSPFTALKTGLVSVMIS
jgi:DNA polymerase III delta subunit